MLQTTALHLHCIRVRGGVVVEVLEVVVTSSVFVQRKEICFVAVLSAAAASKIQCMPDPFNFNFSDVVSVLTISYICCCIPIYKTKKLVLASHELKFH